MQSTPDPVDPAAVLVHEILHPSEPADSNPADTAMSPETYAALNGRAHELAADMARAFGLDLASISGRRRNLAVALAWQIVYRAAESQTALNEALAAAAPADGGPPTDAVLDPDPEPVV